MSQHVTRAGCVLRVLPCTLRNTRSGYILFHAYLTPPRSSASKLALDSPWWPASVASHSLDLHVGPPAAPARPTTQQSRPLLPTDSDMEKQARCAFLVWKKRHELREKTATPVTPGPAEPGSSGAIDWPTEYLLPCLPCTPGPKYGALCAGFLCQKRRAEGK